MPNVISLAEHLQRKSAAEPIEQPLPPKGTQLALPFLTPHNVVLVFADHFGRRHLFRAFAEQTRPHLIVDVRIAPRLDFIANTRALALRSLELDDIGYLDVRGRFEQNAMKGSSSFEDLAAELRKLLTSLEISHRPILMFFDDMELLRRINLDLNKTHDVVVAEQRYIENVAADADQLRM
ncbi:hypothetical protein FHT32_003320 [Variovorax sp. SG517]|uniref:hypothetical protein n=1 Tax=Variovorax sp. SG517 TaxID=2587117 RepID=UPI00159E2AD4|nr:hypothetical protein [Variovorax sp. SG517]NVM89663.1 hypothetical protein [Variovorax sp. SG517]